MSAAVTPSGVRDGDPAALAGLCAVRGPSVLAYCRHVAGDADATAAAAEAFASFRHAVVATADLADLKPELLLVNATRRAAALRAHGAGHGLCADVPAMLAARADKSISIGDLERLEEHLETCWSCRAPVARFQAAERAYRDPPDPTIDPLAAEQIVAALVAAAPGPAERASPAPDPAALNGTEHRHPATGILPRTATDPVEGHALGEATSEYRVLDVIDDEPPAAEAPGRQRPSRRAAAPPARQGILAAALIALGLRQGSSPGPESFAAQPPEPPEPRSRTVRRIPRGDAATAASAGRAHRPSAAAGGAPPAGAGAAVDRSAAPATSDRTRRPPSRRGGGRARSRRSPTLQIVLPVLVVLVALLIALAVSGVLGGSEPASSSSVSAPAAPSAVKPADVVVVPGVKPASGAEVERAKARERAKAEAEAQAAGATPAPAAPAPVGTGVPATRPPAPAATTRPAPQGDATPAPRDTGTGGARRIDAGDGATGAEEIPPAEDPSTVPDLAPPPETGAQP